MIINIPGIGARDFTSDQIDALQKELSEAKKRQEEGDKLLENGNLSRIADFLLMAEYRIKTSKDENERAKNKKALVEIETMLKNKHPIIADVEKLREYLSNVQKTATAMDYLTDGGYCREIDAFMRFLPTYDVRALTRDSRYRETALEVLSQRNSRDSRDLNE